MTQDVSKKIVLYFSRATYDKPIVYRLVKDYDLVFNILKAHVLPRQESYMVMELSGSLGNYRKGLRYLKENGITVKPVERDVQRDEALCYHCGACTAVCATHALRMDPGTMEVLFENKRCSGCGLCMPTCPSRALQTATI
jgi:ferredoxin